MIISRISIKNFRSVEKIENLELVPFNVFVGQNNHGKTNIFEAIEWFFTGSGNLEEICFMRNLTKQVSVEVEFSGLLRGLELITNENQKKALSDIFGQNDHIIIRRDCSYENGEERQLFNPQTKKWENPLGRDSTWRQFLPTLEYINTKKSLEDVAKYGKTTPVSKILSSVLEEMLETDKKYSEFKEMFNELFGESAELINSSRYFELPAQSLEEYYPGQFKANPQNVAGRPNGKNLLAEHVSASITQQDFETKMQVFHDALKKVASLSFGT